MVGRLGAHAIAAVGMGSMIVWIFMSLGISLRTATQILCARRLGQKKFDQCGYSLRNGQFLAFIIGIPVSILCFYSSEKLVSIFISDPLVIHYCIDYTQFCFLGLYTTLTCFVFMGFFTGIEKPKLHMNVTIISNIINIYLNAGFIYGSTNIKNYFQSFESPIFSKLWILWAWIDFPELNVKGAAIATVFASTWAMLHYSAYLFKPELSQKYNIFKLNLNYKMIRRQIKLATPPAFQEILVTGGFAIFYKIMGLIGTLELASTQIVFTIMHSSFMPALGVGQSCATLVGKYLGEGDPEKAEITIIESVKWALYIMGSMGTLFILFPNLIIPIFTQDSELIALSIPALRIVGVLQFIDAIAITLWFALGGAGNTLYSALVDGISCFGFFLPVAYITGITFGWGYMGPWLAFSMHLTIIMFFMVLKIKSGTWKKIQV
jgi:putative MATE family efflux protein